VTKLSANYDFPVWGTQGGGLARRRGDGKYFFVTEPKCPGLAVGDQVPEEWGLAAANTEAREDDDSAWDC
jgi:hypothetical protein